MQECFRDRVSPIEVNLHFFERKKASEEDLIIFYPYFTLFTSYVFSFHQAVLFTNLSSVEVGIK